jgi:hypothetical protein
MFFGNGIATADRPTGLAEGDAGARLLAKP